MGKTISLSVGAGGKDMEKFLKEKILKYFNNDELRKFEDGALLKISSNEIVFTTDSFTVSPIIFPGGDIGKLAICGTYNDLVVSGALPKYFTFSLIIEEGLEENILDKILESASKEAGSVGVHIIAGDTKVVPKGHVDKVFINTAGIGEKLFNKDISLIKEGDIIVVNGDIGRHEICVLLQRENFDFEVDIKSDVRCQRELLTLWKAGAKWMRDITRGGLATILNELASKIFHNIYIYEGKIPVDEQVKGVVEFLGIDLFYLACEGRSLIVLPKEFDFAQFDLKLYVIGEVKEFDRKPKVFLETTSGSLRILESLEHELLPRIC